MEFREEMPKNGEGFYGCSGLNSVSSYDDLTKSMCRDRSEPAGPADGT